ncbi:MAG: aminotransferase class I/II-fold pyridoxal phosphate-dependent enzyme [Acidobacteria bacterium]|nr:aminotransferase class I/II-fold pyridoxal phosphate-dependent enzyme [Acidobacteriota bacterium]
MSQSLSLPRPSAQAASERPVSGDPIADSPRGSESVVRAYSGRSQFRSARTAEFTESVIREMSRLAMKHNAVNLAQGFPDFPAPAFLKQAAADAIAAEFNQYPITWGVPAFRDAIARKYKAVYDLDIDPAREITVVCGSTEGMIASLLATVNEGDEVIVFEPYYENYHPDLQLCGASRKLVTLTPPDWTFDREELRRAFSSKTKAIILNTPNNPTGRVFTRAEIEFIANLCIEHDALCITDEIYEHIVYDGNVHVPVMTIPGMRQRAVLVNSMSKTYSVTGWRVGWVLAAPDLTDSIRKVHDFLTVGAATPLQHAGITALAADSAFYDHLSIEYGARRQLLTDGLEAAGFECFRPRGAYYVMTNIEKFGFANDVEFVRHLIEHAGVAAVPGSSFFSRPELGKNYVRFCFCKKPETLAAASERLRKAF